MKRTLPFYRSACVVRHWQNRIAANHLNLQRCNSNVAKTKLIYEQAAKQIYTGRVPISMFEYPELDTKEEVTAITRSVRQYEELIFPNLRHEVSSILPADYVETSSKNAMSIIDLQQSLLQTLDTNQLRDKRMFLARRCEALGMLQFANLNLQGESFYEFTHRMLIANVINLSGNTDMKARVLSTLFGAQSASKRAYYCVREATCSLYDSANLRTTLRVSIDERSGEKRYILNGSKPLFIPQRTSSSPKENETAMFLVLADQVGESGSNDSECLTLLAFERPVVRALRGASSSQQKQENAVVIEQGPDGERAVNFHDLVISPDEQLRPADDGDALRLISHAENAARLPIASYSVGLMKAALNGLIVAASSNRHSTLVNGESIADSEALRSVALHAAVHIYAVESAAYFTAAQQDRFGDAPLFFEAACCQLLACDALRYFADAFGCRLQLHLGETTKFDADSASDFRNMMTSKRDAAKQLQIDATQLFDAARFGSFQDGGVEQLGAFVAQEGLLFAARVARRDVFARRNMFHAPLFLLRNLFGRARPRATFDPAALPLNPDAEEFSGGSLKQRRLNVAWYLHPSLHSAASIFERDLVELGERSVDVLGHAGDALQQRTATLSRFASCATWLFGAACSLSRASRSLCVGVANAEHERALTDVLVAEHAGARIRANADAMRSTAIGSISDSIVRRETDKMFRLRQYAADHPLMRTW